MRLATSKQGAPAHWLGLDAVDRMMAETQKAGALPGLAYTSAELFSWERRRFFWEGWLPVGRVAEFADKGSQVAVMSAGRNILVAGTIDDPFRSQEGINAVAAQVNDAGASIEIFDYPGAGHLFTDPSLPNEFDAHAAELLWSRVLPFCASPPE